MSSLRGHPASIRARYSARKTVPITDEMIMDGEPLFCGTCFLRPVHWPGRFPFTTTTASLQHRRWRSAPGGITTTLTLLFSKMVAKYVAAFAQWCSTVSNSGTRGCVQADSRYTIAHCGALPFSHCCIGAMMSIVCDCDH